MKTHFSRMEKITESIDHTVRLTSSEIANLWTQYLSDSMAICMISHFLEKVQDQDVLEVLEAALELSETHIEKIKTFFEHEDYPSPIGFVKEVDVINPHAPPLFSDAFVLNYFYVMTLIGLTSYAGAIASSVRHDQRAYFSQCNMEAMELFNAIVDVMLEKGILFRPPSVSAPKQIDFVNRQSYLNGWLGKHRPLNAIEMSGIYFNMAKLVVKIVLELGFSQVVQSKEIRKYFQRGFTLCEEQFESLSSCLSEDNLPSPKKWQSEITNSTIAPFSDKLMLYHVVILVSASAGFYGAGLSVVQRRDLAVLYARLIGEMGLYAEDGVSLLIHNNWLEQPPSAEDRTALAKEND